MIPSNKGEKHNMEIKINYNPYTVSTELLMNGKAIDPKSSPLAYVYNKRLQDWIEPRGNWKGFFGELRSSSGESSVSIKFTGTFSDFEDLDYAKKHFGSCFERIDLVHENKNTAMDIDPHHKLQKLNELYQKLQEGPVDEFKTDDIKKNFEAALNSDFRIVVIASMSSGKSTFINAILGKDLLPATNQATTAVITEIRVNPQMDHFVVSAQDKYGNVLVENQIANKDLIEDLNSRKDPNDPEPDTKKKKALLHKMKLEGPVPNLHSDDLHAVFVDTPGGNNAQNDEHKALMDEAIKDENKSIILYIFDGTKPSTDDGKLILQKIADSMKSCIHGKQSKDRFLFIANKMDAYDIEKESFEGFINDTILPQLSSVGITGPNLFLVSAEAAKLVRLVANGELLHRNNTGRLNHYTWLFNDESEMLQKYASLNTTDREKLVTIAQKYMEVANVAENAKEKAESEYKATEINSGIPAVEMAINEYLDKYAIPIKIKNMHDAFMKKVKEMEMIHKCEEEWASSESKLKEIQQEVQKKWEMYQHSTKLQEYRDRVMALNPDISKFVEEEQSNVSTELAKLIQDAPDEIPAVEAEIYLANFKKKTNVIFKAIIIRLESKIELSVKSFLQNIIKGYAQCITELDSEGLFNIGNYDIKQLVEFDTLLLNTENFTTTKKVKTGTQTIEKRGFVAFLARTFGIGGYENVDIFKDQSFISVKNLIKDQASKIQESFDNATDTAVNDTTKQIDELKSFTLTKLRTLDDTIKNQMAEIQNKVSDQKKLEAEVKANSDKFLWIKGFVNQVENLLTI